ncbi:peptide ABC transporter substrate-binding protein [Deinococcus detaillensis]|uniref:Peptide ABC transporter substrate-binding protein n=1 Tax=Deinococcus detaillensis TaxID=2592048 RepID=A0A553UQ16_9DEIO|nr:ABC transporter substrate-binding protein [Deinococcus detaillensis]TSA82061.1 peptide ABC transporter substrate-binding protein [Deinococcus detaillensis]
MLRSSQCTGRSLVLTLALAVVASAAAQTPVKGGSLTVGQQADIVGLDPATVSAASSTSVIEQLYSSLLSVNPTGSVQPELALKWTVSPDGLKYTFTLRPGVKFADGRPLTAADVVYTIKRITDPKTASPRQNDLGKIASLSAPNPVTVIVQLKEPFAPFLTKVASPLMGIIPAEYDKTHDLNKQPMGSGPFKFGTWVPGDSVTLSRNPNYWENGKPYVDTLVFKALKDDVTRMIDVQSAVVDLALSVPQNQVDRLKALPGMSVVGGPGTWYDYLGLNLAQKPFNDVRVRQALAYAVDRDSIVKTVLFGKGTPIFCGPVPPSSWAYATCKTQVLNLAKAKQLMNAAGYAKGFDMTIKVGADYKSQVNIAQAIQAQLKPLNINVKVMPMEWGAFLNDYNAKRFDAVVLGWIGSVDPDDFLYFQFHTGEKFNTQSFSNKQVDTLLETGRRTVDQAKRGAVYKQVQQVISSQVGYVFLHINDQYEAFRPAVKGYVHYATGSLKSLKDIWIDK